MGAEQMAQGGVPMPPASAVQGQQPQASGQQPPQGTVTPEGAQPGAQIQKLMEAVKAAVQQSVDQEGYVDFDKLVQIWPQIAQQMGMNVPFQTVWQLINQNPDMLDKIISEMGIAGLIKDGRRYSGEQLQQMAQQGQGRV